MECSQCYEVMMSGRCYDISDDAGSLRFRSWRCASCANVIEEIHSSPQNGIAKCHITYPVRPHALLSLNSLSIL